MRNYQSLFNLLVLVGIVCTLSATNVNGQELSKEEAKKWKKTAKDYTKNPAALKMLADQVTELRESASHATQEVGKLQQSFDEQTHKMLTLESENVQLRTQLISAQNALKMVETPVQETAKGSAVKDSDDNQGVWFKVQIGAFKKRKLSSDLQTSDNLKIEEEGDLQKIVVGKFRDNTAANELKAQLKAMGVKDAWVVAYKDGVRVPEEEVKN